MDWSVLEGQRLDSGNQLDSGYQLDKLIGTGAFGAVFDAGQYVSGLRVRRVAIKVMARSKPHAAFQLRELIAAANLRHDALVTCHAPGEADIALGTAKQRLFYIVMELAKESLHGRLRRGALPEADCLILATRIADALHYLHNAGTEGIVHRDIKPGNILSCHGGWKLADLGILRIQREASAELTSRTIGTPHYMPPESEEGLVSPAWDVWSLGITLAEAATGQLPFNEVTTEALRRSIRTERPNLAKLSGRLREVTEQCLEKDAGARPSAADIASALRPRRVTTDPSTVIVAADGSGEWRTISEALQRVKPTGPTTILVKPGRYEETLQLEQVCEIRGDTDGDRPIVESSTGPTLMSVAPSGRIVGLIFRGSGRSSATVEIACGGLYLEDCAVQGSTDIGVRFAGPRTNPILKNCRIEGAFQTAVSVTESAEGSIEGCTIRSAVRAGIHITDRGHPAVRRTVIKDGGLRGVYIAEHGHGLLDQCEITHNAGAGVELAKRSDAVISGCKIKNNGGAGIQGSAGAAGTVKRCDLRENVAGPWRLANGHQVKRDGNIE